MEAKSPLKHKPLRLPGQSVDEEIQRLLGDKVASYLIFVGCFAVLACMEWYAYLMDVRRMPWVYTAVTLLFVVVSFFRLQPLIKRIRALKQGRDGERIVAEQLDILKRDGAFIFHDVLGDYFNIDHVIVCEKGIFVVETKTISKRHSKVKVVFDGDRVFVDGYEPDRNPIDQVKAQSAWLRSCLKSMTGRDFFVRGVLAYPNWWVETLKSTEQKAIWVLEPKALPAWIANERYLLSKEDGSLIADRLALLVRGKAS